eukprot:1455031-Rhodomonas_salina.4
MGEPLPCAWCAANPMTESPVPVQQRVLGSGFSRLLSGWSRTANRDRDATRSQLQVGCSHSGGVLHLYCEAPCHDGPHQPLLRPLQAPSLS